jgi:putative membrane protein
MLKRIILGMIANSAALYVLDYFLANFCFLAAVAETCPAKPVGSLWIYLIGGIILGLVNGFIKPVLKLVSLPITFLTAGLFIFVINAIVIALFVWIINGLELENLHVLVLGDPRYITFLYAGVILGLFNLLTHWLVKNH